MAEHDEQKAYFDWAAMAKIPGLDMAYAVPNGGQRHPAVAMKLRSEGVKPGIPDVQIPVARGGFIGFAIEFKFADGNPSKEQRQRINSLQKEGWCVVICWSAEAAIRSTKGYLGMLKVENYGV